MLKRNLAAIVLVTGALMVTQVRGQAAPDGPSPEDLQFIQQMQGFGQQVMANMQQANIDPQELFSGMAQQMQDGTLDPEAIQQMLMDKGIITPDMMSTMQSTVRNYGMTKVRQQLNVSDDEWAVIQAKIQRILVARADVDINAQAAIGGGRGMGAGMTGGQMNQNASETAKAWKELKAALKDPNAAEPTILAKLRAWRDAHERAKVELSAAQADLVKVVTLRQEAILLRIGLL